MVWHRQVHSFIVVRMTEGVWKTLKALFKRAKLGATTSKFFLFSEFNYCAPNGQK